MYLPPIETKSSDWQNYVRHTSSHWTLQSVETFKLLGSLISDNLSWTANTTVIVKKGTAEIILPESNQKEQSEPLTVEKLLSSRDGISVRYTMCSAADRKTVQWVTKVAQKIGGCPLPSLDAIAISRYHHRALNITSNPTHPAHYMFDLLPSGRQYGTAKTTTAQKQLLPHSHKHLKLWNNFPLRSSVNLFLTLGLLNLLSVWLSSAPIICCSYNNNTVSFSKKKLFLYLSNTFQRDITECLVKAYEVEVAFITVIIISFRGLWVK